MQTGLSGRPKADYFEAVWGAEPPSKSKSCSYTATSFPTLFIYLCVGIVQARVVQRGWGTTLGQARAAAGGCRQTVQWGQTDGWMVRAHGCRGTDRVGADRWGECAKNHVSDIRNESCVSDSLVR
jgi:hypothetical protein